MNNLDQENVSVPVISEERAQRAYELAEVVYTMAEIDAFRDKLRAALAKQAMDNTSMLAALEERYLKIAPQGREEYRMIVRAYAEMAINEMIGGEW